MLGLGVEKVSISSALRRRRLWECGGVRVLIWFEVWVWASFENE